MAMVPIGGLWETHITVSDLDRSIRFYRDVLGLELAHAVPERHVAFFWVGQPRQAMLGLWSIHSAPMTMKLHYAFQVTVVDVIRSITVLQEAGLQPTDSGGGNAIEEPVVHPGFQRRAYIFPTLTGTRWSSSRCCRRRRRRACRGCRFRRGGGVWGEVFGSPSLR